MSLIPTPVVRAIGLTIAFAGVAAAQVAPKECEVNESRPAQVGRATLAVQVASAAQDPAAASKQLINAVKQLTDAKSASMDNQAGRNYVLGKALVLWSMQPNIGLVAKRAALGYGTDPEGTVDLAAAIDTAFKVVETAHPECISETSKWRGQKPWVDLVNAAIEQLNADNADSAEAVARRAILLNPYAPYGYVVLANVMQKRNRSSDAIKLYRQSVDVAARDTAYNDIRRQSLVYLGNIAADSAEVLADAAAKAPYLATARSAFEELLKDKDAGDFLSNARAGMCRVAIASGDTASLRATYGEPMASPANFAYGDLMNAGVCMARADMIPEATKLFEAAYAKNAFHRDALSNLAIMYLRSDDYDKSLPLSSRLVSVEPNNPESMQLLVLSYAGIAKRARDARLGPSTATKAAATKTGTKAAAPAAPKLSAAAADSLFKIEKAYTDSAVSTNEAKEKLAFKVDLSDFTTGADKASIAGHVQNLGKDAKAAKVKVDFLDTAGNVVQSKEQDLGSIAANDAGRFSIEATPGTNIAAFRYTVIQ
jgi:tetratricopeptide (TPR) repeat protein